MCGGGGIHPRSQIPDPSQIRDTQDTIQSLWDPILGSPWHPGSGKIQLLKFSPFSSQFCLTKLPKPPRDHLVRPQNPSAGVPAGNQVLGCLLQCPKTPYNHYGTLPTLRSPGHPGSGKIKNVLNVTHFEVPEKNTSRKAPQKLQNAKQKTKFRKNEATSSKKIAYDHMANLLRLTDELGTFGCWIDGPEII